MTQFIKFFWYVFFILLAGLVVKLSAKEPVESITNASQLSQNDARALSKLLSDILTYQADFTQSVYRENSREPEVSSGKFAIQRPKHFSWRTKEPFEQSIVADGKNLWTYDPELEQVTIQDQRSVLSDSPLLLLTSSVESLIEAVKREKESK